MKEIIFIRNNIRKWQDVESIANDPSAYSPDDLADAYTDTTADLAFAYTHYPNSRITLYLNNLCVALHNGIYRNKKEKWSRLITFWTQEVPDTMFEARRLLLAAFIIMMVSVVTGIVSQLGDHDFCRIILGDAYVDMTLENIKEGMPMNVYTGGRETNSFLEITQNNIGVSFNIFAMGMLTCIGSGIMLFYNGVMVGCFETLFWQHGLLGESMLAVFLHGTLELSAIVVAGAAGIALGNGILFPGTYSRITAFRRGAKRGLKIVVGTVPIFIVAGFIEGFLTRHTEVADGVRLSFIIICLAFVIFYFVVLPRRRNRKQKLTTLLKSDLPYDEDLIQQTSMHHSSNGMTPD